MPAIVSFGDPACLVLSCSQDLREIDAGGIACFIEHPHSEDIEEAAGMVCVDFIVNVVLDAQKKIIKSVAGDMISAHRVGCAFLDTLYRKELPSRADIVLVSQGGAPKDLNLYQTQKALDNAKHAVKPGGVVVLIGSCKEGLGEKLLKNG